MLTAFNSCLSSPLQTIKQEIKKIFQKHAEVIDTHYDAPGLLPQQQLLAYGVQADSVEETYIFQAIKKRMHRDLRARVKRVFPAEVVHRP